MNGKMNLGRHSNRLSNKIYIIVIIFFYILFFIFGYNSSDSTAGISKMNTIKETPPSVRRAFTNNSSLEKYNFTSIGHFYQKLNDKININTLNELFIEAFDDEKYYPFVSESKQAALMEKFGEILPLVGLQKLSEVSNGMIFVGSLFKGWSSKNPDAAFNYYNDHLKNKSPYAFVALNAIIQGYTLHSPSNAWNKLTLMEKDISSVQFSELKKSYNQAVVDNHPALIPDIIAQVNFSNPDEVEQLDDYIFKAGLNWAKHNQKSRDWIESIPDEKIRLRADTARIMGITKGNVDLIDQELNMFNNEESQKIKSSVCLAAFFSQTDKTKVIDWAFNTFTEESLPPGSETVFRRWIFVDYNAAIKWIHSLPQSPKKESLNKWKEIIDKSREN